MGVRMKNLAIIPARSGSKGLSDKNIKPLGGKPLLAYSIDAAKDSGLYEEILVSTDSEKYAELARGWGASVPFLRNFETSNDTASLWDVAREVIRKYKEVGKEFDTVTLLQPTSPLRLAKDIAVGFTKMAQTDARVVISVCEVDHCPLLTNVLPPDASLADFINPDAVKVQRQSLPTYYRINGALYIIKTEHLLDGGSIYDDKSFAIIMPKDRSVDIDDAFDFKFAEVLLKENN